MEVVGVWRYPVKSLQGESLDHCEVERDGLAGDRRWGIRDGVTGRILTARRRPELLHGAAAYGDGLPVITLPDGQVAQGPGADTDRLLSEWLDSPVSLVSAVASEAGRAEYFEDATDDSSRAIEWTMPESRYVDAAALLVLTTAALRAARALNPSGAWDPRRFRPNVLVDATEEGWVEDGWYGHELRLGEALVHPLEGCVRCTMVTREQPGLEEDREVFRTLARHRQARFGAWCAVAAPGTVGVGEPASVVDRTSEGAARLQP